MKMPEIPAWTSSAAWPWCRTAVTTRTLPSKPCCFAERRNCAPLRSPRSKSSNTTSICLRCKTLSAVSIKPQCATTSNPRSARRSRTKLSRKRAWSSTIRMVIAFFVASGMDGFFDRAHRHGYNKAGAGASGFVGQIAAETLHDGARHKKAQPTRLPALKRPEQIFRSSDADASILEADNHTACFLRRGHAQPLRLCGLHRALAVLCQIQEDLNESVAVGPNQRQGPERLAIQFGFLIHGRCSRCAPSSVSPFHSSPPLPLFYCTTIS